MLVIRLPPIHLFIRLENTIWIGLMTPQPLAEAGMAMWCSTVSKKDDWWFDTSECDSVRRQCFDLFTTSPSSGKSSLTKIKGPLVPSRENFGHKEKTANRALPAMVTYLTCDTFGSISRSTSWRNFPCDGKIASIFSLRDQLLLNM